MFRGHNYLLKFVSLFTLVSFLIMTSGCSRLANIPIEEYHKEKIKSVLFLITIYGIKLSNGTEIYFDKKPGFFDAHSKIVIGITKDNVTVTNSYDQIEQIIIHEYSQKSSQIRSIPMAIFLKEFNNNKWVEINGISVRKGDRFEFDKNGGVIDSPNQQVVGYSNKGDYVKIPFNEIMFFQSKKTNWLTTGLLIISVSFTLLMIAFIIDPPDINIGGI